MTTTHIMTPAERKSLQAAAHHLHARFRGVFGEETIHALLQDSYQELAATATVTQWLAVGAERFARERLEALAHAQNRAVASPAVLFLCVHNAGRSQMALGWFRHLAAGRAVAWSAGTEPARQVNPAAVLAMAEAGIDITAESPSRGPRSSCRPPTWWSPWAAVTRAR